jgi:hypothetical protein
MQRPESQFLPLHVRPREWPRLLPVDVGEAVLTRKLGSHSLKLASCARSYRPERAGFEQPGVSTPGTCAPFLASPEGPTSDRQGRGDQGILRPAPGPAWQGAMIGHVDRQFTLPIGIEVEVDATAGTLRMLEPAVLASPG